MDIYKINTIGELINGNHYVGRGIITGTSSNGMYAVNVYFIMGRSANSRNRVFEIQNGELFTKPFDETKVEDPSLIIYPAVREYLNNLIVTNGDQTDTIYEGLKKGVSFKQSLESREFEPDKPNYTPRISSLSTFKNGTFSYEMSILKSIDEVGSDSARYTFSYKSKAGLGHFIHTYVTDGSPIPTFQGEPERVAIPNDIKVFAKDIWENLDENNKISLYVRYTDIKSGEIKEELINKNVKGE